MNVRAWVAGSLERQFPKGIPGRRQRLHLTAARGERLSFQVGMRLEGPDEVAAVTLTAAGPAGAAVQVRRVGYVPVRHHNTHTPIEELDGVGHIPGYVPDVLWPENTTLLARGEIAAFWITVTLSPDIRSGRKTIRLRLTGNKTTIALEATIDVMPVQLQPRRDFRVTHWFYADAIADWYRVEPFSDAFWPICQRYMLNYAAHGNDTIYVPVFTPPLDGVKRPSQLLGVRVVGRDRYRFDWSNVDRWIKLARRCGIGHFEWVHLFSQWGVKHALRIYQKKNGRDELLWDPQTPATSPTYRRFLAQFLPELREFIRSRRLTSRSYFHVSDEPHGAEALANYRAAREMLRELAPWMQVMDALTDIAFARQGLTDMPIPSISTTRSFREEGIDCWTYFCCGPRGKYLNRLMDTPLAKIRMSGWLFYRFGCRGFLHWGYNYWQKSGMRDLIDPFCTSDAGAWPRWAYGDPFVVYPGEDGPLDSIRWEVFAESLQDYALLQTLGIESTSRLLQPLRDFNDFPTDATWLASARKRLLYRG